MLAGVFEISDVNTSAKFKQSERPNGRQILLRRDGAGIILSLQIVAVVWLVGRRLYTRIKVKVKASKTSFWFKIALTRRSENKVRIWLDCEQALFWSKIWSVFACKSSRPSSLSARWLFSQARSVQDGRENSERDDRAAKPLASRSRCFRARSTDWKAGGKTTFSRAFGKKSIALNGASKPSHLSSPTNWCPQRFPAQRNQGTNIPWTTWTDYWISH